MIDRRRLVTAAIVAPLAAPVAIVLCMVANHAANNPAAILLQVSFALAAAYVGMLAFGIPAVWLLRRVGALNVLSVTLTGAVGGIVIFYAFLMVLGMLLRSSGPFGILQAAWGAALGFIVAASFSAIAGITWRSSGHPQAGAP